MNPFFLQLRRAWGVMSYEYMSWYTGTGTGIAGCLAVFRQELNFMRQCLGLRIICEFRHCGVSGV